MMKKLNPFYLFVLFTGSCFWQCSLFDAEERVNIAGTVVSLTPPEEFVQAPHVAGIWNKTMKATIMVGEIPRKFSVVSQDIKKSDSLGSYLKVLSEQPVEVDGRTGILYQVNRKEPPNNYNQWMLILPNAGYTTAISGTYPVMHERRLSAMIRESVLSSKLENDESKLFQAVPYEVRQEKPILKLAKVLTGPSLVYTADGVWSDSSMFATAFYVGPSYPLKKEIDDKEKFARENYKKICSTCVVDTTSFKPVMIDSLEGLELWGYTSDTHKLKYQTILFKKDVYYLMVGTAIRDQDENLQAFRYISRSFRRKEPAKGTKGISS